MKNLFALLLIVALSIFCSCQKHLTDEELQARIEKEVKRQLAAEREAQQKELEQRRAQLAAQRNALLSKQGVARSKPAPGNPQAPIRRPSIREGAANPATTLSPGGVRRPQLPPGVTIPERSGTLPEFPRSHVEPPQAGSETSTSKTLAAPPVAPAGTESPSFSPLPEAVESASPTATPGADATAQ
jgi:hypothetical protein